MNNRIYEQETIDLGVKLAQKRYDALFDRLKELKDWSRYYLAVLTFIGYSLIKSAPAAVGLLGDLWGHCKIPVSSIVYTSIIFVFGVSYLVFMMLTGSWFWRTMKSVNIQPFPSFKWDEHFKGLEEQGVEEELARRILGEVALNKLHRVNSENSDVLRTRLRAHMKFRGFAVVSVLLSFVALIFTVLIT